ncbi:DNA restriction-modification system, DNA methylase [Bifidobacterium longum subsp. longum]|uniref:Methyltransferase n=2 Tax=Bifidobacterium TaxID=1678 RepID=A0A415FNC3_BIFAD|nr:site-specific DNA-methyltransferase [Bifidobacterium longum]RHK24387.1 site-specific DNA-methyltransferase [Bifidobacterium adolescentis]TCF63928.1 DNA restriction-modification system, DNA methylase [Bifidobacterium longum subsp. longum]
MPKKVQQTEHPVLDMTMPERKATDMSGFFRDHKLPDQNVTGFSDGALFTGDSIEWMKTINDESIDMVFADPPYNIKKADWDDFGSQERYIEWSMRWIEQASRILKPTGSLYVCGFSEILADLKHPSMRYFSSCRWLVWFYRNKANLGKDWGRSHESILHLRKKDFGHINYDDVRIPYGKHTLKYPDHPQADSSQYGRKGSHWTPNPLGAKPKDVIEIPTTCNGMNEKTPHPTQKPEELLRKLILASSSEGDLVLDPFSGSGTTAVVASQLHRQWLACDENPEYNQWATQRLDSIDHARTVEQWMAFDRDNYERRRSIR